MCQWLVPDEAARRQIFPAYFRMYVEHAMADGLADPHRTVPPPRLRRQPLPAAQDPQVRNLYPVPGEGRSGPAAPRIRLAPAVPDGVMMRSIQYHQYGGPELMRLEEVEPGSPGNGQMLVRVRAAAANPKVGRSSGAMNFSDRHARGRQARHSPVATDQRIPC